MNKWVGLGRIVRDQEIKYTPSQKVVATFTLAVNRDYKNQEGKYDADFIPVVAWGKTAELIGNSCKKGHRLLVEGRIQVRSYEDKNGQKRFVTEVIASNVEFVERKEKTMQDLGEEIAFD